MLGFRDVQTQLNVGTSGVSKGPYCRDAAHMLWVLIGVASVPTTNIWVKKYRRLFSSIVKYPCYLEACITELGLQNTKKTTHKNIKCFTVNLEGSVDKEL